MGIMAIPSRTFAVTSQANGRTKTKTGKMSMNPTDKFRKENRKKELTKVRRVGVVCHSLIWYSGCCADEEGTHENA